MTSQDLQMSHLTNLYPPGIKTRQKDKKTTSQDPKLAIWQNLYNPGKKSKKQKYGKTTPQDLHKNHLTKFLPPWKKDKKTYKRDLKTSKWAIWPKLYPQEKSQKDKKTKKQHLKTSEWAISHLTKFIPHSKKRQIVRQKDEKTTSQDLYMSHVTKFKPPQEKRRKDGKQFLKTSKWVIWPNLYPPGKSRPPNET